MKLSLRHMIGEPLEIAHLGWRERTALMEEARKRNHRSPWGRRHRRLFAALMLLPLGLLVIQITTVLLTPGQTPGNLLYIALIASSFLYSGLFVLLFLVDSKQGHAALQELMLERGIRPAVCFKCRYDLRKSTGDSCPECGEVIATEPGSHETSV